MDDPDDKPAHNLVLDELIRLLDVTPDVDLAFLAQARAGAEGLIYGGQVIAQALMAATRTVDAERAVHSLHAYFLRGGDDTAAVRFEVSADFDGGSFSNRRVIAVQHGRPIFNLAASFQRPENRPGHARKAPIVDPPEALHDLAYHVEHHAAGRFAASHIIRRKSPFDIRVASGPLTFLPSDREGYANLWFKLAEPRQLPQALQRVILAYMSDFTLLPTVIQPYGRIWSSPGVQQASIDHAMWFHRDVNLDDWLLFSMRSPWAGNGRGFSRGNFFHRDGSLIASCAQEGLFRIIE